MAALGGGGGNGQDAAGGVPHAQEPVVGCRKHAFCARPDGTAVSGRPPSGRRGRGQNIDGAHPIVVLEGGLVDGRRKAADVLQGQGGLEREAVVVAQEVGEAGVQEARAVDEEIEGDGPMPSIDSELRMRERSWRRIDVGTRSCRKLSERWRLVSGSDVVKVTRTCGPGSASARDESIVAVERLGCVVGGLPLAFPPGDDLLC